MFLACIVHSPSLITMPNFVKISQKVAEILHFVDFSKWRLAAVSDFQILKILTASNVRRAQMHHHDKFHQDQSSRCRDITIFPFFKVAANGHLGFLNSVYPNSLHHMRSQMHHRAKFRWKQLSACGDIKIWSRFVMRVCIFYMVLFFA